MLRTIRSPAAIRLVQAKRFVHDPFQSDKPTSETHATEKTDKRLNVQSDAVGKGMQEKKDSGLESGKKQKPEDTTRAPGPVIGMQDERGKLHHPLVKLCTSLTL